MISPQDPQYPEYVRLRDQLFDAKGFDRSSGKRFTKEEIDSQVLARLDRKQRSNGSVAPGGTKTESPHDDPGGYTVHKDEPRKADENAKGVALTDFYAYMPMHSYIFAPTGDMWPAASVNARIDSLTLLDQNGKPITDNGIPKRILPNAWLDRHKPIEQMTWAPGKPMLIRDRLISDGGWLARDSGTTFNLYPSPTLQDGHAAEVGPC